MVMTINEAFADFIHSKDFKEITKMKNSEGGKYRVYLARFNSGELKAGAIADLLIAHGYEIQAGKVTKKPGR